MRSLPILLLGAAALGGCATMKVADTEGVGTARVSGDPAFSAGLPVQVLLRQVDGRRVDVRYSSIEVPAGRHQLLVDCRVAESGSTTRHALDAELFAGVHYRLVAIASTRSCEGVELESR